MAIEDPYDLRRFHAAQIDQYETALAEIRAGRKQGHWIWFIFPQMRGLGHSESSRYYGIGSIEEARAYLADPVLAGRLRTGADALLAVDGRSAVDILGSIDATKVRSSMTLFHRADPDEPVFRKVLDRFYDGDVDRATDAVLAAAP
jgi:uncharacterized protein (DUF1810 family)